MLTNNVKYKKVLKHYTNVSEPNKKQYPFDVLGAVNLEVPRKTPDKHRCIQYFNKIQK